MKRKEQVLQTILDSGIIAVIRAENTEQLLNISQALCEGGVKALEVTMTTPGAIEIIHEVSKQVKGSDAIVGVGTVLDTETCRAAILAGAEFVVGPCLNLEIIKMCRRYSVVCIPGTYTPTEILAAWEAGADIVKVFPADNLGPQYFKALLGPLPQIRLTPTGGVDLNTITGFIQAGACCVGAGSNMIPRKALAEKDWKSITTIAKEFVLKIKEARGL